MTQTPHLKPSALHAQCHGLLTLAVLASLFIDFWHQCLLIVNPVPGPAGSKQSRHPCPPEADAVMWDDMVDKMNK